MLWFLSSEKADLALQMLWSGLSVAHQDTPVAQMHVAACLQTVVPLALTAELSQVAAGVNQVNMK